MGSDEARGWLSPLLALTLVACGGRYAGHDGNDVASPGGATTGGAGIGASGSSSGGIMSMGAPVGSVAGTSSGTGGESPGLPTSDIDLCGDYCDAFVTTCPEQAPFMCSKTCWNMLASVSGECLTTRRDGYACIIENMRAASSCSDALARASKLCDSDDGRPPICTAPQACPLSLTFENEGCRASMGCPTGTAELACTTSEPPVPCSCLIDGVIVRELTSTHASEAACSDAELRAICMSELP